MNYESVLYYKNSDTPIAPPTPLVSSPPGSPRKPQVCFKPLEYFCYTHFLAFKVDPFLEVKVLMISHFYVSFVCCKEDIATSIFRTFFYIWLQKHSKIVFVNRNHSNLLVACGFKRWNNDSGCHALLPSIANLIFSTLHPL